MIYLKMSVVYKIKFKLYIFKREKYFWKKIYFYGMFFFYWNRIFCNLQLLFQMIYIFFRFKLKELIDIFVLSKFLGFFLDFLNSIEEFY